MVSALTGAVKVLSTFTAKNEQLKNVVSCLREQLEKKKTNTNELQRQSKTTKPYTMVSYYEHYFLDPADETECVQNVYC